MNTGILSMQRISNYGSFLQALSLKSLLEEWGNTVEFIDIKPEKIYEGNNFKYKKDWNNREFIDFIKKRDEIIAEYGKEFLNLSEEENFRNDYDFAIIGSDEVFNCIGEDVRYSPQLFGKDVSKYTITYAASCGHTNYEQVKNYNLHPIIKEAMGQLKNISVRDKNTFEFVKKITDRIPIENLDPVFIYNFDKYLTNKILHKEKYVIIYSYDYRLCNPEEVRIIKKFASDNHLKTIGVGVYQPWCDENINVTPFELIEYFKKASYVITDTFHGAIFSIKYNKKFVGIARASNCYKFNDLLERFNLASQNINHINELETVIKNNIDYERINYYIEEQTKKSKAYLMSELEKAKLNINKGEE